jgi:integrase/recombinase XerD
VNALDQHLAGYLRARRAMGFKLVFHGEVLPQFAAYLDRAGAATVTSEHAIAWACLPQGVAPTRWAQRLSAVRGFSRYLKAFDPATEIPPRDVFVAHQQRRVPHIWTPGQVRALLEEAHRLPSAHRALTHETVFGLLAATGMRISEVLGLSCQDVDLQAGVLSVRWAKNSRSRIVPLHPSTTSALRTYQRARQKRFGRSTGGPFFASDTGAVLNYRMVRHAFVKVTTTIGMRTETVHPRIHDLRHSFAVHTLIGWQRSGVDVGAQMARLSTYLGHADPAGTYWYLSAVPELMAPSAARLHAQFGAKPGAAR